MQSPTGFLLRYPERDLSEFIASLEVARSVLTGERDIDDLPPQVVADAADAVGAIARKMEPRPSFR